MFFIDKYNIENVNNHFGTPILYEKELDTLKKISADNDIPHMIFFGPSGSGVQQLINMFLKMIYTDEIDTMNETKYIVNGSNNKETEIIVKQSNYHIVIEPNNNNFDKYLVQDIIKGYARRIQMKNVYKSSRPFKTVLINNMDNMSYCAQTSLRRTMEIYSDNCKFILWCNSLSKVIEPLKSRCSCFRVEALSDVGIMELAMHVSYEENITQDYDSYRRLLKYSKNDIEFCLWYLQLQKYGKPQKTPYQKVIDNLTKYLFEDNISDLLDKRELFYKSTITSIPCSDIIEDIMHMLLHSDKVTDDQRLQIAKTAAYYEYNIIKGRRKIIHFDAFLIAINNILTPY